jgi:uncharacterized secreted protein with C-terminal beta-propeller domain
MSATERFSNRIVQIKGVDHFVLTRQDGQIITHNLSNPEQLVSVVTLGGYAAQAIQKRVGFSQFRYLVYTRPQGRNLIVFSFDKYLLGIQQKADTSQTELVGEVSLFLQHILNRRNESNG